MNTQTIIIISLLITSNILQTSSKLNPDKVILAINCGGDEYKDSNGIEYSSDKHFSGGEASDYGLQYEIKNTKDEELYQTERWSSSDLTYNLPSSLSKGEYVLILKFSEVYFSSSGDKVFDIGLGTRTVLENIDIYDKVGKASSYDEFIRFRITSKGRLEYEDKEIPDAYDSNKGLLKIVFKKGKSDNPKINAILLYAGDISDTDYAIRKKKIDEEMRRRIQEKKKASLIIKKHDVEDEFDEELELSTEDEIVKVKAETSLVLTLFSRSGISILVSLILFVGLYLIVDSSEKMVRNGNGNGKVKTE